MNPDTLVMVLQIIQAVEAGLPVALALAGQLKTQLAKDPSIPGVLAQLNAEATQQTQEALALVATWRAQHP